MGNTYGWDDECFEETVHPHACGEYGIPFPFFAANVGSSPRVWGIRGRSQKGDPQTRFIPTRVGNTTYLFSEDDMAAVHPHACGEYLLCFALPLYRSGSSPRVWGIQQLQLARLSPLRFIPTRVGNTLGEQSPPFVLAVHPHACGEYRALLRARAGHCGSSPRVWGILAGLKQGETLERFIPTRVGNTCCVNRNFLDVTVHPHACGEYSLA